MKKLNRFFQKLRKQAATNVAKKVERHQKVIESYGFN